MNNGPHYPRGRYLAEVIDQGLTKAKTGTVQIALKIRVLQGTQPADDTIQQYERTVYLPVTEKTIQYVIPKLQALGYTRDSFKFIDKDNPQYHDLTGVQAEFFCKHENDQNGELREKWDVCSAGGGALELDPPDAAAIRKLDALFGKQLKTLRDSAPKTSARAATATSDQISDDDVPF